MTSTLINHGQPVRRIRRSAEQWHELFTEYEASGLSQSAFCQQRGLAIATFSKWLARLRDSGELVRTPSSGFVEVQRSNVGSAPPTSSPMTIRLDLGAGMTLEISRG